MSEADYLESPFFKYCIYPVCFVVVRVLLSVDYVGKKMAVVSDMICSPFHSTTPLPPKSGTDSEKKEI